jgi:hypothetical protein
MTTSTTIRHEPWCMAPPGADKPRIESYLAERTGPDGTTVIARPRIVRCVECAAMAVIG